MLFYIIYNNYIYIVELKPHILIRKLSELVPCWEELGIYLDIPRQKLRSASLHYCMKTRKLIACIVVNTSEVIKSKRVSVIHISVKKKTSLT